MRVILDTNIFISREDNKIVPESVQKLLSILNQHKIQILVHPSGKDDIERDKDIERKKIIQSKISSYNFLDTPPDSTLDSEFHNKCGIPKNDNDKVDSELIYAIYKNAVDFLITEDKGIQQKSRKLDISDRILSVAEGIDFFQRQLTEKEISIPRPLQQIPAFNVNINDPIFDSLKGDYPEFGQWWSKVCKEGRTVIVYKRDNQSLGAIYLHKLEEEAVASTPPLPKAKRLKICTLKVVDNGYKLGEFFLKKAFEFAIKNNIFEIYLTHVIVPNDPLVGLIEEFGFENIASKGNEQIFLKKIIPIGEKISNILLSKIHFPCLKDGKDIRKFLIPIIPTFHNRLFPEFEKLKTSLFDGSELIPEGNTIKKAYLCNSKIKKIRPGDLVLFYLSREEQEITTIGTVETVFQNPVDTDDIVRHVGKRTVYSIQEIKDIYTKKSSLVLLFLFNFYFPNPVSLKVLKSNRILNHAPQSILELSKSQYEWIKSEGELDERFTFN